MVHIPDYETFVLQHQQQLISSKVPEHFWTKIHEKITSQIFDTGNAFDLMKIDYEDDEREKYDPIYQLQVSLPNGIEHSVADHVYLIDHAWTFRVEFAKKQLLNIDKLRARMASIMGISETYEKEVVVEKIFDEMWKYANTYSIGNAQSVEERLPVWYIMDEVGCGITHSDNPNFRMVPFIYIPENLTYSLMFPIKQLEYSESVTRDFAEGICGDERKAYLLPWVFTSFENCNFHHVKPTNEYFLSGHIEESLPNLTNLHNNKFSSKQILKVFAQYEMIHEYLNDNRFEIVENESDADIYWYTVHFKNFNELSMSPKKFINQFPFEYILTLKDLLSITCRLRSPQIDDSLEIAPEWLPITFNLKTEVLQFASYFQRREKLGLDNHWIIKPFNLARGLDTHITNNLNYIMRLPATGFKVAQKYIEKPILFNRPECGEVKFDIRYVLLLKSVKPLQVYVYKNFFLRFANLPFALNDFDVYEKHFTVMNYNENSKLKHMLCSEFITQWEEQYPKHNWSDVEIEILNMVREIFECATLEQPPRGLAESPQSRALYAADIMLEWNKDKVQPKLLEINWTPDCKRACQYYPNFYNDIFKLLFLDIENNHLFYKL